MANVDNFRRIAERARGIPGRFGLREHSVDVVHTWWDGENGGARGNKNESVTRLLVGGYNPKVSFPSQRDIALNLMSFGTITIGPFTPQTLDGLGISRDLINRDPMELSDTLHLIVTGPQHPEGCKYKIQNVNVEKAIHFTIVASTVSAP